VLYTCRMEKNLLLVILLGALVFFANLGGTSIYILDEAKNTSCAMEMYERDSWIVPTFNGELRFDKPPLHYFFMKSSFALFGVNTFASRFFSALCGLLMVCFVYMFTKRNLNKKAALYASLILLASLQIVFQFHLAVPDPYLLLFYTVGLLCFIEGIKTEKAYFFYLFYACLALATLAKGPVAIALPGLTVLAFLLAQRALNWGIFKRFHIVGGGMLFLTIALPWYVLVHVETNGLWTEQFFFKHNVSRFAKTMEGHGGFPLASLAIAVAALVPFSFFAPQMLRIVWADRKQYILLQFSLIAVVVVISFFALSRTILPSYIGPALPFLSITLGYYFSTIQKKKHYKGLWISASVYTIVAIVIPVAIYYMLQQDNNLRTLTSLALWFVILPIGAFAGLYYILKTDIQKMIAAYTISAVLLLLVFFCHVYPTIDAQNPVARSLATIANHKNIMASYREFNPAYVVALQRVLPRLQTPQELKEYLTENPEAIIVTQKKYLRDLTTFELEYLFEQKDLFENPTTILFRRKQQSTK
jgi:4-amino-4-deoxy-L-arabinose transferase-like glycosyltransferase